MQTFYTYIKEETDFLIENPPLAKAGFDYEARINHRLKAHGLQRMSTKSAGSSAHDADGLIHHKGAAHRLEVKQNKSAMMGQLELHHNGTAWHVSENSKKKNPATAAHVEKHFIHHINQHWDKPTGDYDTDLKKGNVNHIVKGTKAIRDHYGKDRKTPYMHIGAGSGLHHMHHDEGHLGTHELQGDTHFRARMKYRKTDKKTGKKQYGALVVMGLKNHNAGHHSPVDLEKDEHLKRIANKK